MRRVVCQYCCVFFVPVLIALQLGRKDQPEFLGRFDRPVGRVAWKPWNSQLGICWNYAMNFWIRKYVWKPIEVKLQQCGTILLQWLTHCF